MDGPGSYEVVGRGADMAIEVMGPDAGACLASALAGLADSLADVPDDAPRSTEPVELTGDDPAALLHALVQEAIVRLDADGMLVTGLRDARIADGRLTGELTLVSLADVEVHGIAPKAATWHDLRLERGPDGWTGVVMLDL